MLNFRNKMLIVLTCLLTRPLLIDVFLCVLVMDIVDCCLEYVTVLNMCSLHISILVDNCEVIVLRPIIKARVWDKEHFIFFVQF